MPRRGGDSSMRAAVSDGRGPVPLRPDANPIHRLHLPEILPRQWNTCRGNIRAVAALRGCSRSSVKRVFCELWERGFIDVKGDS